MNLIDTHAHLYLPEFHADFEDVVSRAKKQGYIKFCCPISIPHPLNPLNKPYCSILRFHSDDRTASHFVKEDWEHRLNIVYHELKTQTSILLLVK